MPKAPKCMSFSYIQLRFPEAAPGPGGTTKVLFIAVLLPAEGKLPTLVSGACLQQIAFCGSPEFCSTHDSNTVCVSAKIRGLLTRNTRALGRATPNLQISDLRRPPEGLLARSSRGRQRRLARARSSLRTIWRRQTASTFCRGNRADYQYRRSLGSSHA